MMPWIALVFLNYRKKIIIIIFKILISEKLYGNKDYVEERHRHRYEVNKYFSFETGAIICMQVTTILIVLIILLFLTSYGL